MKKFHTKIRIVLIFIAAALLASQVFAQPAKTKPAAKPKSAPAASPQSGFEAEIIGEIINLRTNPGAYIKYLEEIKPYFKGNVLKFPNGTQLITSEGPAVVEDTIAFLKGVKSVPAFKLSPGLVKASGDHLRDLIGKDLTGHKGSDGSWPPNRVERYGMWSLEVKENISYQAASARDIVLNMLLDDGNPKREHRKNLLSSNLRYFGVSAGDSKTYGRLCVVVFAGEFTERRK